jgi:hypothetical protein
MRRCLGRPTNRAFREFPQVPRAVQSKVDELVRSKRLEDALDLVDRTVLIDHLGFTFEEVTSARVAWVRLRDRRIWAIQEEENGLVIKQW